MASPAPPAPPALMAVHSVSYSVPAPAATTTTTTTVPVPGDDLETELQQGTLDPKMLCAEHDMPLTHYCREDRMLECEVCLRRCNQGGHRLVAVAQTGEAIQAMLEDVAQMGQRIEQTTRALEASEMGVQELMEDTFAKTQAAEDVIINAMSALRAQVDELQSRLLRGLNVGAYLAKTGLMRQKDALQACMEELGAVTETFDSFREDRPTRVDEVWDALAHANGVFAQSRTLLAASDPQHRRPEFVLTNLKSAQLVPILRDAAQLQISLYPTPQLEIPDVLPNTLTLSWTLSGASASDNNDKGAGDDDDVESQPVAYTYEVEVRTSRGAGAPSPSTAEAPSEVFTTRRMFYVFHVVPQEQYAFRVRVVDADTHSCGYWSELMYATAPPAMGAQQDADARVRAVPADRTALEAGGLGLRALPQAVLAARQLTVLRLGGNQLASVPYGVAALAQLTELDVRDNRLAALPDSLGLLGALETLDVSGNRLAALPETLGRLARLRTLVASGNRLAALPASTGDLGALRRLVADGNELARVPPSLVRLRALEELSLAHNRLRRLPRDLDGLRALQVLALAHNTLASVPDSLARLPALRVLDLAHNRVRTLPAQLGALQQLEVLRVGANALAALPDSLAALTALQQLAAPANYLRALPPHLGTLCRLTDVDLADNALAAVPRELFLLPRLRSLDLHGNPCAPQYANAILATGNHVVVTASPSSSSSTAK